MISLTKGAHKGYWTIAFLAVAKSQLSDASEAAYSEEKMRACLERSVLTAEKTMTIKKLEEACAILLGSSTNTQSEAQQVEPGSRLLNDRIALEALNRSNRFVLTPHKRNYILPVSYTNSPNTEPYHNATDSDSDSAFRDLRHAEFEFQLSVKILLRENIFDDNGHLFFGYTNHSLWQVYNHKTSSPFRETNHEPELILSFTNDFELFGFRNSVNEISLNHQSNGQSGTLSRSWNRVMFNSVFESSNLAFALTPWYRIPEDKARYPGDPGGDDNPDIGRYMGNFQFTGAYKYNANIFSVEIRDNLRSNNRGAIEMGWTFPLTSTMRGYASYFNGYGHSLIDYNVKQQVVGMGITFADLF